MKELLHDNPRMQMDVSAARVISAATNIELEIAEGAEVVDMCKAIDDMMSESRSLGIAEGRSLGIAEGRIEVYRNLRKRGFSKKEAADLAEIPDSVVEQEEKESIN